MKKNIKKFIRFVFSKNMFLLVSLVLQLAFIIGVYFITNNYVTKILGSAVTIFAFFVALIIDNSNLHCDIKLAYIIILVLFPFYGTLTYLLGLLGMGNQKFKRHLRRIDLQTSPLKQPLNVVDSIENITAKGVSYYMLNSCHFPTYQNTNANYFKSGEEQFEQMLKDLRKAKNFIFLEYYIIQHGEMLDSIMEILTSKVQEGVEIRFLYDGTSSIAKIPHSFVRKANKLGIKCKMFMPVKALLSTEQNNRDHRKLLIIDNKIAYTGGANLADEYINKTKPFGYWKDVGIKIEGEAVISFTQMFLKMWNFKQREIEDFTPYLSHETCEGNGYFIPICDHPHDGEDVSKTLILQILANARDYVHITTPYLIIDDELRNALCTTARRGVDVKIITPSRPDKKLIFYVTQTNYKQLIENGVKIYQYLPGFIHAKMIVSDNQHAVLGTVNLDYRSLFLNFEDAVYIYKNDQIDKIASDFDETLINCKQITKIEYRKINIIKRFIGRILKPITPLL